MSTLIDNRKRKHSAKYEDTCYYPSKKHKASGKPITKDFISRCNVEFHDDSSNVVARNAIATVGSLLASTNSNRANKVSHVFLNTVKPKNLKATDQGHSGRCWMFSGLNVLRTIVIKSLGIDNFEFSQTYLFFWDKWERANVLLTEIIDHPNIDVENRYMEYLLDPATCFSDGGWWNMFANLVSKYGLMPKSAFGETYQSYVDSGEMNDTLRDYIVSTGSYIHAHPEFSQEKKNEIREEALVQVHSILCKYLGEPPSPDEHAFSWEFTTEDYKSDILTDLSPLAFKNLVMPTFDLEDFVVIAHLPVKPYYQKYEVVGTNNVVGGKRFSFVNVPIEELKKYTMRVIDAGLPVWFTADVGKSFHPWYSTLDEGLFNKEELFGEKRKFTKADRINFRQTEANHAMVFTGYNVNDKGPVNWQVENSWGYWDEETPGLDGWLTMSDEWFNENVFQIAFHKNFLGGDDTKSRHLSRMFDEDSILLPPWNNFAPALKVGRVSQPENYRDKNKSLPMMKRMLGIN